MYYFISIVISWCLFLIILHPHSNDEYYTLRQHFWYGVVYVIFSLLFLVTLFFVDVVSLLEILCAIIVACIPVYFATYHFMYLWRCNEDDLDDLGE